MQNTAFFLGELISEITLFNADDKAVFGPYNLTCPPLAVRPELGVSLYFPSTRANRHGLVAEDDSIMSRVL